MKALLIIAIIFIGVGIMQILVGSLFKIQHWPGAGALLICGTTVKLAGILLLVIYLVVRVARRKGL